MKVDENIVSAIRVFFLYALPPGSYTELLLRGKFDEAKTRAHMMLRDDDIWSKHVRFVTDIVPGCCKNENYDNWNGYTHLTPDEQEEIIILLTLLVGGTFAEHWTTYSNRK